MKPSDDALEADRRLFAEVPQLLPSKGRDMTFVRDQPFDASYEDDAYQAL